MLLPAADSAPKLNERMFVQGDSQAVARQRRRLEPGGTILDALFNLFPNSGSFREDSRRVVSDIVSGVVSDCNRRARALYSLPLSAFRFWDQASSWKG